MQANEEQVATAARYIMNRRPTRLVLELIRREKFEAQQISTSRDNADHSSFENLAPSLNFGTI